MNIRNYADWIAAQQFSAEASATQGNTPIAASKALGDAGPRLSLFGRPMKSYVMTSGVIFGLLALAHVWRVIEEGPRLATDPGFVLITLAAAGLAIWAWRTLRTAGRP